MMGGFSSEFYFKKQLIKSGYEEEKIISNWGDQNQHFDFVVLGDDFITPIVAFEVKVLTKGLEKLNSARNQLNALVKKHNLNIPLFIAFHNKENNEFEIYDAVREPQSPSNNDELKVVLPTYLELLSKQKSLKKNKEVLKKKKYIDVFKVMCWVIIPVMGVSLILLDLCEILAFTTERMIVWGVLLLIIMLPFFNEISVKDISLRRQIERKKGE